MSLFQSNNQENSKEKLVELGIKYGRANNNTKALEYLEQALKLDPKYPRAWRAKGQALLELGEYFDSIECFDKAIEFSSERDEDHFRAWHSKGICFLRLELNIDALRCFSKVEKIRSDYVLAYVNKATAFYEQAYFKESEEYYN